MGISLAKGQKISLTKEGGAGLSQVVMGLGWDQKKAKGFFAAFSGGKQVDLDASCLMLDESGQVLDSVWYQQLRSKDGSIQHTGDNLTGAGAGDDEQINVNLSAIPENVKYLVFTINSFSGQTFASIENAFCRLIDQTTNAEIARYNLTGGGAFTAQIMAKLYRHNGEWKMHAIGEGGTGQTFKDLAPQVRALL